MPLSPTEPSHATPTAPTLDYRTAGEAPSRRRRAAFWFAVGMMVLPTSPFLFLLLIAGVRALLR